MASSSSDSLAPSAPPALSGPAPGASPSPPTEDGPPMVACPSTCSNSSHTAQASSVSHQTSQRLARPRGTDFSLQMASQHFVQESVQYLLVGIVAGVLGFLAAVTPLIIRFWTGAFQGTMKDQWLPATVSELVSKWEDVEARVFFGFELCAGFCFLLSWYPLKLRNVTCIPAEGGCQIHIGRLGSVSWATFRQFVPPVGLVLTACVPTVVPENWNAERFVLVVLHAFAAMLMFVGFLLAEAHAIEFYPLSCPRTPLVPGSKERRWRTFTWHLAAWPFAIFLAFQGWYYVFGLNFFGKVCSFCTEVFAGLAMMGNHLCVWYFAPERHWVDRGIVGSQAAALQQGFLRQSRLQLLESGSSVEMTSSFRHSDVEAAVQRQQELEEQEAPVQTQQELEEQEASAESVLPPSSAPRSSGAAAAERGSTEIPASVSKLVSKFNTQEQKAKSGL